jgi:ferredoxin--NADP+ reductase
LSRLGDGSTARQQIQGPRIRLAYQLTPKSVLGQQRVTGAEFSVTGALQTTRVVRRLDAGLVLTSIGYRGKPIPGLPFDEVAAVVPNEGGRVMDTLGAPGSGQPVPGAYVAGWIKRGPTGFIGTNKSCSFQTVQALVADFNAGKLTDPVAKPAALTKLVHSRQPDVVDSAGWRAIDAAEIAHGADDGRPRNKFTDVADMLAAAATAPATQPLRRRLVALLRDFA